MDTIVPKLRTVAFAAFLVSSMILGSTQAVDAQQSDAEIASMMEEISRLSEEERELPQKVQANLVLKANYEKETARIEAEKTRMKPELDALEAERPGVRSLCEGTVPDEEYAAAQARCRAVLDPFNARREALKERWLNLIGPRREIERLDKERAAAYEALQERKRYIEKRLQQLKASLLLAKRASCVEKCSSGSNESVVQCQAACWDRARDDLPTVEQNRRPIFTATPRDRARDDLPTVEQNQRPIFKATPSRTPEQAIEEYKVRSRTAKRTQAIAGATSTPCLAMTA